MRRARSCKSSFILSALAFALLGSIRLSLFAEGTPEVIVERNQSYLNADSADPYAMQMCKADLYFPPKRGFPLLVWIHGGGMIGGSKIGFDKIATLFAQQGVGVVAINYRLSPQVKYPVYIDDCALAVAWARNHADEWGVDPNKIFVGGHSAGAYLTLMLALNHTLLTDVGVDPDSLAGFIPISGEISTHFTVIAERKLPKGTVLYDSAAPLFYVSKQMPPLYMFVADSDMPGRLEENKKFLMAAQRAENQTTQLSVIARRTHETIESKMKEPGDPVFNSILQYIRK
jgi:acetyl esterase/lipase